MRTTLPAALHSLALDHWANIHLFSCYPNLHHFWSLIQSTIFLFFFLLSVSCICVSVERSTVVLSFLFEICRLYGGFFTSPKQLDDYPNWRFADGLSYIKYVFMGIALNELTGLEFSCTAAQISSKKCTPSGQTIIEDKGYDKYTIGMVAGILVFFIVGTRFIGYLGLRFGKA